MAYIIHGISAVISYYERQETEREKEGDLNYSVPQNCLKPNGFGDDKGKIANLI